MIFGLHFRERLQKGGALGNTVILEFQRLMASLRTWGEVEHNDDGTHGAVTAESVAVSGDLTVEGNGTIVGDMAVQGSLDLSTDDNDIGVQGIDLTGSRVRWDTYPATAIVADNLYPVVEISRALVPAVDNSIDIGHYGSGSRRFKNGVFSGTLEANQIYGVLGIYERTRNAPMGEWTAYTPTVTGITLGASTLAARYAKVGKTVFFEIRLILGAGFNVTGNFVFTTPSAFSASMSAKILGNFGAYDTSAAARYSGQVYNSSTTEIICYTHSQGATAGAALAATVPFTWASGDQIFISGVYEET